MDNSFSQRKRGGRQAGRLTAPMQTPSPPHQIVQSTITDSPSRKYNEMDISNAKQTQESEASTSISTSNVNDAAAASGSAECRRSSRKKIIKFDVRDLLNKNRKPHKIQIEARIDSNAPETTKTNAQLAGSDSAGGITKLTTTTSTADLTSKQKTFIEKSAIFRRYSISAEQQSKINAPLRPPLPPVSKLTGNKLSLLTKSVAEDAHEVGTRSDNVKFAQARRLSRTQEIFNASMMKSKQNSSLIIAQMESSSSSNSGSSSMILQRRAVELAAGKRRSVAVAKTKPSPGSSSTVAKQNEQTLPFQKPGPTKQPTAIEMKVIKRRGRPPKNKYSERSLADENIAIISEEATKSSKSFDKSKDMNISKDAEQNSKKEIEAPSPIKQKLTPEKAKNWQEYKACLKICEDQPNQLPGPSSTLTSQSDVVLEISSSSESESDFCQSPASDESFTHITINKRPAKQRNFAAVSFLQESTSSNDDNVASEPEFIVASVEEIITEPTIFDISETAHLQHEIRSFQLPLSRKVDEKEIRTDQTTTSKIANEDGIEIGSGQKMKINEEEKDFRSHLPTLSRKADGEDKEILSELAILPNKNKEMKGIKADHEFLSNKPIEDMKEIREDQANVLKKANEEENEINADQATAFQKSIEETNADQAAASKKSNDNTKVDSIKQVTAIKRADEEIKYIGSVQASASKMDNEVQIAEELKDELKSPNLSFGSKTSIRKSSSSSSESDSNSDRSQSKSYKNGDKLRVSLKRLSGEELSPSKGITNINPSSPTSSMCSSSSSSSKRGDLSDRKQHIRKRSKRLQKLEFEKTQLKQENKTANNEQKLIKTLEHESESKDLVNKDGLEDATSPLSEVIEKCLDKDSVDSSSASKKLDMFEDKQEVYDKEEGTEALNKQEHLEKENEKVTPKLNRVIIADNTKTYLKKSNREKANKINDDKMEELKVNQESVIKDSKEEIGKNINETDTKNVENMKAITEENCSETDTKNKETHINTDEEEIISKEGNNQKRKQMRNQTEMKKLKRKELEEEHNEKKKKANEQENVKDKELEEPTRTKKDRSRGIGIGIGEEENNENNKNVRDVDCENNVNIKEIEKETEAVKTLMEPEDKNENDKNLKVEENKCNEKNTGTSEFTAKLYENVTTRNQNKRENVEKLLKTENITTKNNEKDAREAAKLESEKNIHISIDQMGLLNTKEITELKTLAMEELNTLEINELSNKKELSGQNTNEKQKGKSNEIEKTVYKPNTNKLELQNKEDMANKTIDTKDFNKEISCEQILVKLDKPPSVPTPLKRSPRNSKATSSTAEPEKCAPTTDEVALVLLSEEIQSKQLSDFHKETVVVEINTVEVETINIETKSKTNENVQAITPISGTPQSPKKLETIVSHITENVNVETKTLLDILKTVQSNETAAAANKSAATNTASDESPPRSPRSPGAGTSSPQNVASKKPTTIRRYERRSKRGGEEETLHKTLEETFAEIAAESSKAILELVSTREEQEKTVVESKESSNVNEEPNETNIKSKDGVSALTKVPLEIFEVASSESKKCNTVSSEEKNLKTAQASAHSELTESHEILIFNEEKVTTIEDIDKVNELKQNLKAGTTQIDVKTTTPPRRGRKPKAKPKDVIQEAIEPAVETKKSQGNIMDNTARHEEVLTSTKAEEKCDTPPVEEIASNNENLIMTVTDYMTTAQEEDHAKHSKQVKANFFSSVQKMTEKKSDAMEIGIKSTDQEASIKIAETMEICSKIENEDTSKSYKSQALSISVEANSDIRKDNENSTTVRSSFKVQNENKMSAAKIDENLTTLNKPPIDVEENLDQQFHLINQSSDLKCNIESKSNIPVKDDTAKSKCDVTPKPPPKKRVYKPQSEEEPIKDTSASVEKVMPCKTVIEISNLAKKVKKATVKTSEKEESNIIEKDTSPKLKRGSKLKHKRAEPATETAKTSLQSANKKKQKKTLDEDKSSKVVESSPKTLEKKSKKLDKKMFLEPENDADDKSVTVDDKLAKKKRQKKLKEAFEAALNETSSTTEKQKPESPPFMNPSPEKKTFVDKGIEITPEKPQSPLYNLPLTPTNFDLKTSYAPIESLNKESTLNIKIKPPEEVPDDPLKDIEKFIEDGVNLLKRGYKIDDIEDSVDGGVLNNAKKLVKENSDESPVKQSDSTNSFDLAAITSFAETPANTPLATPTVTPPPKSPLGLDTPSMDFSDESFTLSGGVRRSHRIKLYSKTPKALVGRGLVRDKERFSLKDDVETKSHYTIDDHRMDLAEVEAKNAKFLKDMEERLSNFRVIKENEYKCERVVSKEAKKMICDCFLTADEEERGELACGEDCLNRLLMIECGPDCNVKERCTNKRFQKFLCSPCRVFRTEKKGFGILADVEILPGEFIMEYVGEVINGDEFEHRRVVYSMDKNRHYYFMALRSDAIIDATSKGNISRFINHSCDPNAETQKWTVNGELRIGFFSRKSIMPGEEITFDYQYQRYGREAQRCYCESANCRGWIGEEPNSDEGEQIDDESDGDEENLAESLLAEDDDDDEDDSDATDADADAEEAQKKLERAAAEAKLMPIIEEDRKEVPENVLLENEKPKASDSGGSVESKPEEDSKSKFKKLLNKMAEKVAKNKKQKERRRKRRNQLEGGANDGTVIKPLKPRYLEDPDIEDEVHFLSRCGLKNQSDTLRLSRLMVRAKLVQTRLNLLKILRSGDLPCRRLFLDYHGLRLLHGWISEDGGDLNIRLSLLETLESLPIANKTMLTDSKVYQAVCNWCGAGALLSSARNSLSPSDESSKESTNSQQLASNFQQQEIPIELQTLASKLTATWDSLPEIFRIPKRERIEQMKEHEREADRQYASVAAAREEEARRNSATSYDRYQRDRFGRVGPSGGSSNAAHRFTWSRGGNGGSINAKESRNISVLGATSSSDPRRRGTGMDIIAHGPTESMKHLSKEQRREMFAAKVARDEAEKRLAEERREFETKCRFFGLDPKKTRPQNLPFCVNPSTGQWYSADRQPIPTPPSYAHVQVPTKPKSTNPADYQLPPSAVNLSHKWKFAITPQGKIYYYHVQFRIPQWEPPTPAQLYGGGAMQPGSGNGTQTASDSGSDANANDSTDDDDEIIKGMEPSKLQSYVEQKVEMRRQQRYNRLVDERSISPRREEDRIYNQIEVRKYKENKEKIRKRKEEIRRKRVEAVKNSTLNMCTLGSLEEALAGANEAMQASKSAEEELVLPIQDYLLSSDEEEAIKAECNNSPLIDKIVQGDKIVDELDALTTKRPLKRPLPSHRDLSSNASGSSGSATSSPATSTHSTEKQESHKKRKLDKRESSKSGKKSKDQDSKYRKLKEKFRCEIAGIIVHHLRPYRKDGCIIGRIQSNDDFNHLARKLTHFVMIKELKYCESVGQTLVVTESVKNKSREFIKKYMAKYGDVYVKPGNDPEFKDIPFTL